MKPRVERELLVHFICESDAIERITDDPATIDKQLRNKNITGHVGALRYLQICAETKVPLTEMMLKKVHSLIVSEQHKKGAHKIAKKHRGAWRDCNVWVGGKPCPDPGDVPSLMEKHLTNIVNWQHTYYFNSQKKNIAEIAKLHLEFLRIHPFIDGNGRTSRALVYYLYRFARLPPFIFTAHDRHLTYYRCFDEPVGDKAMRKYFLSRTVLLP